MTFLGRWLVAEAAAFILFPLAFVLWQGRHLKYDFLDGLLIVAFLQFMSPLLWLAPFAIGTAIAVGWQVVWEWKASQSD
jgi:hypothetical protein